MPSIQYVVCSRCMEVVFFFPLFDWLSLCIIYFISLLFFSSVSVTGTLKGYDQLLNLVLDEAVEFLRGNYLLRTVNMLIAVVLLILLTFELYSLMNVWCLVSMKSTDLCRVDWNYIYLCNRSWFHVILLL